ncbi:hypothetical protein AX15_003895 [Amanita polypyramis BW_CC]|nr:hypothetical protein AX15_003895 [Amanita polypyramis BW_CC]
MWCLSALVFLLIVQVASANWSSPFVKIGSDGRFQFNGSHFPLLGTNVYWLPALNSVQDIDYTLGNISQTGFNVVRTWAFNDVTSIPENGTWFQLINNGTVTVNEGPNGLQKLDKVIELAEKHKLFLILSLTNNWNPLPADSIVDRPINFTTRDVDAANATTVRRNYLSNQYGGMDVYVRELGQIHEHDQFYINETLINAFENYTTQVVKRYVNSPNLLSWEIANDPRCASSISASNTCVTTTITRWHSRIAKLIKTIDPNHLVSSGASGFFCADCPKLFPRAPRPSPSPSPQSPAGTRRSLPKPLTKKSLLKEKKEILKKMRATELATRTNTGSAIRIRGRWLATPTKRQGDTGVGPAFNGAAGVDSEDIMNIPQVGFGSSQLFPDQNTYGLVRPSGPPSFNESLAIGLDWVNRQIDSFRRNSKPIVLTGFGLVTQENSQSYVPFNAVQPVTSSSQQIAARQQQQFGPTNEQRNDAYQQWLSAALSGGLSGAIQYQWSQSGVSVQLGTPVSTPDNQTPVGNAQSGTGTTPNDGYSIQGTGNAQFQQIIGQDSQTFGVILA